MKPKVMTVLVSRLVKAAWNYKTDGTPEQIDKLAASAEHDKSVGVLAVRELPNGKLEVMDGNHRLDVLDKLGWKKVMVENFGSITEAEAVTVAHRRNYQWFQDDVLKLSTLFRDVVLPVYPLEDLSKIMPDTIAELSSLVRLSADFDWTTGGELSMGGEGSGVTVNNMIQFNVIVTRPDAVRLDNLKSEVKNVSGNGPVARGQVIAYLLKLAGKKKKGD